MYQKIEFLSRSSMTHKKPESNAIVISISSSNMQDARIAEGFRDILFMKFDNNQHLSDKEVRFTRDNANEILDFVRKNEDAETIYVNCIMGESRSAAVAQALGNYYKVPLQQDTKLKSKWIFELLGMQALRHRPKSGLKL